MGTLTHQRSYLDKTAIDELADDFKMKYKDNWEEIKVMIDNPGGEDRKTFQQVAAQVPEYALNKKKPSILAKKAKERIMAKLQAKMNNESAKPDSGEFLINEKNLKQDLIKLSRADSSVKSFQ